MWKKEYKQIEEFKASSNLYDIEKVAVGLVLQLAMVRGEKSCYHVCSDKLILRLREKGLTVEKLTYICKISGWAK